MGAQTRGCAEGEGRELRRTGREKNPQDWENLKPIVAIDTIKIVTDVGGHSGADSILKASRTVTFRTKRP